MTSVGISAFGFNDSVDGARREGFVADRPSCVLLPELKAIGGRILTGIQADESRVENGFHWPPESRLPPGERSFRRIPVSLLWRKMIACKELPAFFGTQEAEKLVQAHIDALCPPQPGVRRVIAIPNTLSTASQERLLRAFGSEREAVTLLWRPVAAVLGWISLLPERTVRQPGWVGVCCLGADGFEFTKIRLSFDKKYPDAVIPERSRPRRRDEIEADGFDLAQSCASKFFEKLAGEKPNTLWQALLRFPDVWDQIRGIPCSNQPVLWSNEGRWDLGLGNVRFRGEADYSSFPCPKTRSTDQMPFCCGKPWREKTAGPSSAEALSWREKLAALAERSFGTEDQCVALIVCGPLCPNPRHCPSWLREVARRCGLRNATISTEPALGRINLISGELISWGAGLYGEILDFNKSVPEDQRKPTYRDTLPRIRLYGEADSELKWQDLFEKDFFCEGGQETQNTLEIFSLQKGCDSVDIWLEMHEEDEEPEEVDQNDLEKTPYRFRHVHFKRSAEENVPLRLEASMKPSNGFAKVFFEPRDPKFGHLFRSGGVSLNFEDMERKLKKDINEANFAWPPNGKIELAGSCDLAHYKAVKSLDDACRYRKSDGIYEALCLSKKRGETTSIRAVNEKGEQNLFDRDLFEEVKKVIDQEIRKDPDKWIKPASWLWEGCSDLARNVIFERLSLEHSKVKIRYRFDYAARVAKTDADMERFLSRASDYTWDVKRGIILPTLASSLTRLLDYHPNAAKVLSQQDFLRNRLLRELKCSVTDLQIKKMSLTGLQWFPSLLAVLLKIRKWDADFLSSENERDFWRDRLDAFKNALDVHCAKNSKHSKKGEYLSEQYKAIGDWLRGRGNNVPLISEELDDGDKEEREP